MLILSNFPNTITHLEIANLLWTEKILRPRSITLIPNKNDTSYAFVFIDNWCRIGHSYLIAKKITEKPQTITFGSLTVLAHIDKNLRAEMLVPGFTENFQNNFCCQYCYTRYDESEFYCYVGCSEDLNNVKNSDTDKLNIINDGTILSDFDRELLETVDKLLSKRMLLSYDIGLFDSTVIPPFQNKGTLIENPLENISTLNDFYIKSTENVTLDIGGNIYVLCSGCHYFPSLIVLNQEIKLVFCNCSTIIWNNCTCLFQYAIDTKTFNVCKTLTNCDGEITVFINGSCTSVPIKLIY